MTKFTDPKALQILKQEQAANDAFFVEMDAKIKAAQDNTVDEQIWTTPNQRRLIAAAPELLEALKETVQHLEMTMAYLPKTISGDKHTLLYCECEKRLEAARAAILKA